MIPARFFIVGCQRSGTTLMKLVLECHSAVGCYDEHLAYQVLSGRRLATLQDDRVGFKVPRLTEQLAAPRCVDHDLPAFANAYSAEPLVFMLRDCRDTVASMMCLAQGNQSWFDRWGLPSLECQLEANPRKREHAASILQAIKSPRERRLAAAALYWRYKCEAIDEYRALGYPVCPVRYEDLVSSPARELSRVCAALDVPWEDALLEHDRRPHSEIWRSGRSIGDTDPRRPIDRTSVGRWNRVFGSAEIDVLTAAAGPLQQRFYPLGHA